MIERTAARHDAEMTKLPGLFDGFSYAEFLAAQPAEFLAAQPAEFLAEWYTLAGDDENVVSLARAA